MSDKGQASLEQILELAYQHAKRVLIGSCQELMPVFALESAEQLTVHGCPWRNDKEKAIMGKAVKLECQRRKVFQYSFVCEAWAVELKSSKDFYHGPASKDPRRIEVVIALAVNRQEKKIRQWKIERSEDGTCTGLTLSRDYSGGRDNFESWMAELLEEEI